MSNASARGVLTDAPSAATERIMAANRAAGHHFFEAATMRFFNSTVYPRVYAERYFITSEFYDADHPEAYSIRAALDNGHIASVGDFQGFASYEAAEDALILALGRGGIETRFDPYDDALPLTEADASLSGFHWRTYIGELVVGVRTDRAAADRMTQELVR